nr:hypothetical protein [Tanacetum cinerariifolium]
MSSPDHSTSNNEDAFSSNISDYVSTILDYFTASSRKTYSNGLNDSTSNIPMQFSPFYNMKDIQAFYAKELAIPSLDPITPPFILTPSPVLPPSLLIKGKKPSKLMLSIQLRTIGMLETFPRVEDVDYIIQDLVVLCVIFETKWATRPSTAKTKDQPTTIDACPNACEMWKAIERLKQGESINVQDLETNLYWEFGKFTSQDGESLESYYSRSQQAATRNRGKAIVNSPQPIYDQEASMVAEDDETSKEKEIDKLMDLISLSFKKIYKPTNNNLRTSSNTGRANQDNSLRINRNVGYENQRIGNVAGAREIVGSTVVQKSRIQCYNCKEFGHVARDSQKPKRAKDAAYHREKMFPCKQEEVGIQLNAEQADWKDDTDDDELEDQELEAHYMYMAQLQEVSQQSPT